MYNTSREKKGLFLKLGGDPMKRKQIAILLLALVLALTCGCGRRSSPEAEAAPAPVRTDDKYREWYEVFVWSFADSNGDGIGDLPGLTGKLDYIRDLGCNGIWLMPVMPSPSYHKYDVTDYYAIDPVYGTMEDFHALIRAAHERGIRVIVDLPINHTSDQHPWFLSASQGPDAPCRDYYNWSDQPAQGFAERNGSWYECRFVDTMPDLALDNPAVRQEIESILRFWLEEAGADGFRLDAVTSYYSGNTSQNVAFLTWLGDTAHAIDPDCFLVGEAWDNLAAIAAYSQSSVDSFFLFPMSQSEGWIAKVLGLRNKAPGAMLGKYLEELTQELPASTIPAPFLENHDTGRTVGFTGRDDPARTKMAGGLLCMMPGGVFVYYGQEIGMVGSGDDPNKRIGMLWSTPEDTTSPPPGVTRLEYAYPSVSEQEADPDSILNYYKKALALRARFPAIARGTTEILPCDNDSICLAVRTWQGQRVLLAVNPSRETQSCDLDRDVSAFTAIEVLIAGTGAVSLESNTLTLPAYSIAVLTPEK